MSESNAKIDDMTTSEDVAKSKDVAKSEDIAESDGMVNVRDMVNVEEIGTRATRRSSDRTAPPFRQMPEGGDG